MPEANSFTPDINAAETRRIVSQATENAKLKMARLKRLKERHEVYLAARRSEFGIDEEEFDDDVTREL